MDCPGRSVTQAHEVQKKKAVSWSSRSGSVTVSFLHGVGFAQIGEAGVVVEQLLVVVGGCSDGLRP